ncbi:MAG: S-methyl-5-thioribose-1-phosphate isomerase [Deltaproteobacteria bacterium]|nr:S-methyl-5-thioribose-1-phosphate isomerase [Deltaproteobacteria bacterium]MBW2067423.1 S-methyl-5-thioribose-1-phosphate isomerase [Deltaproteobacteria bacterium]
MTEQSSEVRPLYWDQDVFMVLDQRLLPGKEKYIACTTAEKAINAIKTMAVRGAPAVGLTGAAAVVLGAKNIVASDIETFLKKFDRLCERVKRARPTGYNLEWAVERMRSVLIENADKDIPDIVGELRKTAEAMIEEDVSINRAMGQWGKVVIPPNGRVLTYCNAGALATGGYGTALGVIRAAWEEGKNIKVFACETRPFFQGSRLTVFELTKDKIPVTLITDNTAGFLMQQRKIDVVIVGADRITANGDVANKIGTYTLAVLAKAHNIPFYVAAPRSTIDSLRTRGDQIPIEQRPAKEVITIGNRYIAPQHTDVLYYAFDVTPSRYISGIITEVGIITKPYKRNIREALQK